MNQNEISNSGTLAGSIPYLYASYEVGVRFGRVAVIDPTDDSIVTHIPVGSQPGAMCMDPLGNKVYVVNTGESSVSIINTENNKVMATLPVGRGVTALAPAAPTAVIVHPFGQKAYVANSNNHSITVIDNRTNKVLTTLPTGVGQPFAFAVSDNNPLVFVACKYKDNKDYILTISVDNNSISTFGMNSELTFDPPHNPLVIHPDGHTVGVLGPNGFLKYFNGATPGEEKNTSVLDNTVSGVYFGSAPAKLFTTSPPNKAYLKYFEDLSIKASGEITPVKLRDIKSYRGQDQIRVCPNPEFVCITVQATANTPCGLQIYNEVGTVSQFIELYYAGDLTITQDSTKAYVEQRSVIVPIDLATATAGAAIDISSGSSDSNVIIKNIVASYETQNSGTVVSS
ncbi:YncE family protein [Paenibacillus tritici]|uniref:YncE family protein n=1 Tax=Paenibacillus tritici TaxID=1873425 RepID=UPI001BAC97CE|nr:YncE family protein [Paenibacillus tritici]QUL56566.1 YncE family protein [Paenibacillus tritici]